MKNQLTLDLVSRLYGNTLYGLNQKGLFNLDSEYSHPSGAYEPLKITNLSKVKDNDIEIELESIKSGWGVGFIEVDEVHPYLFPFSSITEKIQISSYNNGEPFIPLEHLALMGYEDHDVEVRITKENYSFKASVFYVGSNEVEHEIELNEDEWYYCPTWVIESFNRWHINYRLPSSDFIEVTNENNPYL